MSKKCDKCGAILEDNDLFCDECGASVSEQPKDNGSLKVGSQKPEKTKKKGHGCLIVIILAIVGFIGLAMCSSPATDESTGEKMSDQAVVENEKSKVAEGPYKDTLMLLPGEWCIMFENMSYTEELFIEYASDEEIMINGIPYQIIECNDTQENLRFTIQNPYFPEDRMQFSVYIGSYYSDDAVVFNLYEENGIYACQEYTKEADKIEGTLSVDMPGRYRSLDGKYEFLLCYEAMTDQCIMTYENYTNYSTDTFFLGYEKPGVFVDENGAFKIVISEVTEEGASPRKMQLEANTAIAKEYMLYSAF